jgi:hypothetical protein
MDPYENLSEQLVDLAGWREDDRRASVVANLAVLTLLIDAGLPVEDACKRLEHIHAVLPEEFRTPQAMKETELLTIWLRAHCEQGPGRWTPKRVALDDAPTD